MRLSDVEGDRTLDVIADLIEPVANIAEDPKLKKLFEHEEGSEDELRKKVKGQLVASVPGLLRSHKADVIAILAALKGVSAKEYAEGMSLGSLLKELYELITDEELLAFLS